METNPNTSDNMTTTPTTLSRDQVSKELNWMLVKDALCNGTPKSITVHVKGEESKCFKGDDRASIAEYLTGMYMDIIEGTHAWEIDFDVDMG